MKHSTSILNWRSLEARDFEELCATILDELGFINIVWHGEAGADRGRDLTAQKADELISSKRRYLECIVQCKHAAGSRLSPADLQASMAWAEAHSPDIFILMTSTTLTSSTKDWLSTIERTRPFRIYTLERLDLELQLVRFPHLLFRFFQIKSAHPLVAEQDQDAITCGFCGSPTTIEGAYFVLHTCDGCSMALAMCYDCMRDTRKVHNDALSCRECGKPLRFANGTLYLNLVQADGEMPNKAIDGDEE